MRLREPGATSVAFAYSPVYEAALSLHVLADARRHAAQHHWVRKARRLPASLRRRVEAFKFAWIDGPPDFLLPAKPTATFDEELQRLQGLPDELVAFEFLRPFWDHGGRRDPRLLHDDGVREHVRARVGANRGDRSLVELLFEDPSELRAQFLALIGAYWEAAFSAEWADLEGKLAAAVVEAREVIEKDGIFTLLEGVSPRLVVDRQRAEVGVDLPHDHHVTATRANPLMLVPSAFVWPSLQVNCDEPFPLTLVYPAPFVSRATRTNRPDPELTELLRALSDETRLRALRLIAEAPRSTQELAALVSISEPGLSKHLRILSQAKLLETRREGYYVLYCLAEGALDRVPQLLNRYLR